MAVNVKTVASAGLEETLYNALDSAGYSIGSTGTAPVAGDQDGVPSGKLADPKDFPFQPATSETEDITGGDGHVTSFQFKPITSPQAQLSYAVSDMDFAAMVMGVKVHTLGGGEFLMIQPDDITYVNTCWITVSRAESRESGSLGVAHWAGKIILNTEVYSLDTDSLTERTGVSYLYQITSKSADRYPYGLAFSVANNGDTAGKAVSYTWPYKPMIDNWTGDNIETTFNLSEDIAEDSANNILVYVDGVVQTWVTGIPGAGEFGVTEGATDTLVLGTAPGSAAKLRSWYGRL